MNWRDALAYLPAAWKDGRLVRKLGAGPAADTYLIAARGGQYVMRVDRPLAKRLGLRRDLEWSVLRASHAAGLGPRPAAFSASRGVLITEFVPGEMLDAALLRDGDTDTLERLAALLRRLHRLPGIGQSLAPAIAAYRELAGGAQAQRLADEAVRLVRRAEMADRPACLCHNDPNAANIITGGESWRLIDWEYAGDNDPLFDLAVVAGYHGLDDAVAGRLLAAYLRRAPDAADLAAFALQRALHDRVLILWAMAVRSMGKPSAGVESAAAAARLRLAAGADIIA